MSRLCKRFLAILFVLAVCGASLSVAPIVQAAPVHDNFANAQVIASVPFTEAVSTVDATTESDEPFNCSQFAPTVWYRFTPNSSGLYRTGVDIGSTFESWWVAVYRQTGPSISNLSFVGCAQLFGPSAVTFSAEAGTTYYLQVGKLGTGSVQLNLTEVPPPANDNFASASSITSIPFSSSIDTSAATAEPGEPSVCLGQTAQRTAWYVYTPASTASLSASTSGFFGSTAIAVYTGNSIGSLTQVACGTFQMVTVRLEAGTTYHFQVGALGQQGGPIQFNLASPPPPSVGFGFFPNDPSTFDDIQFFSNAFDPAGTSITVSWTFGDGGASTEFNPRHRYVAEGQYTVKLIGTTSDGRMASTTQVVRVATHDVGITRFDTPQVARVGRTREITVGVSNDRQPERVQVQLLKGTPNGNFEVVGTLVQTVPVRAPNKTTPFTFNYTFTDGDAAIGKVTFMATATVLGARDALPADNQAVAFATVIR